MGNLIQPVLNFLGTILTEIKNFFSPIVLIFSAITAPIAAIVAAFANPEGWVNEVMCRLIDMISSAFPSTPAEMKISALISSALASYNVPNIAGVVLEEILIFIVGVVVIDVVFKLWKLLPFT